MVTTVILSQDGLQLSLNITDRLPWFFLKKFHCLTTRVCCLSALWTPNHPVDGVCTRLWRDSLTCWVISVCRHEVRSTGTQHTAWRRPDLRSGGVKEVCAIPPIVTLCSYVCEWKPQSLLMTSAVSLLNDSLVRYYWGLSFHTLTVISLSVYSWQTLTLTLVL